MNKLSVPTESDWRSEPWCLDAEYAYGVFNEKTYGEALRLFEENAICRQEDLSFMPVACFPFYYDVFMDYLLSNKSQGDSDGASCFLSLVIFKIPEIKKLDPWIVSKTIEVVTFIRDKQAYFDAEIEIYGSFDRKADEALRKILS